MTFSFTTKHNPPIAAEQQSSRAAEQQSSRAAEQQSSRAAEQQRNFKIYKSTNKPRASNGSGVFLFNKIINHLQQLLSDFISLIIGPYREEECVNLFQSSKLWKR